MPNSVTKLNATAMEKAYKLVRAAGLKVPLVAPDGFGFEVEIIGRLAQVGARRWGLAITYSGRTYAEGKKITWRDGLAALVHIVRFNLLPPGGDWRTSRR